MVIITISPKLPSALGLMVIITMVIITISLKFSSPNSAALFECRLSSNYPPANLCTILNSHQIGHSRKQDNYCVTNTFQFFPIHLHKFDRQYGQVNLQLMMKWYRDVR